MKKIFILLLSVVAFSAQSQVTFYNNSDTISKTIIKGDYSLANTQIKDSLVNNTANTITITWSKSSQFLLTDWQIVGLCDKITCYSGGDNSTHTYTLAPGEKCVMYVDLKALPTAQDGHNYVTLKINDGVSDRYRTFDGYNWPTKVNDLDFNSVVSIYPNPATNFININILDKRVKNLDVLNVIGKRIAHFPIDATTPNPINVSLDNIAKGVYLLQFADDNGKILGVKRVAKQ